MKKLIVFLFLSVTGLNVQVIGREPQALLSASRLDLHSARLVQKEDREGSILLAVTGVQQDTSKKNEQHTGKAVRDPELEEQMNNDPDNRNRSIPNTTVERDTANVPEP